MLTSSLNSLDVHLHQYTSDLLPRGAWRGGILDDCLVIFDHFEGFISCFLIVLLEVLESKQFDDRILVGVPRV